ncbi:protein-L-isoaspartate O-methyltransferase family protein [Microvirga massiliensis]|uniref:protein-L-isoaspartate O-methyltransferase family protein n=1 Tax=Microvirga massiliensis TaxID=1033741 RepID=UPI00093DDDD2|nr:hypothetical protein [Microvirga massiliensis]
MEPIRAADLLVKRRLPDMPVARSQMVDRLVRNYGIGPPITDAMLAIPRHAFAPPMFWRLGYAEMELWAPGQFLVKPSVIARIASELVACSCRTILEYSAWTGYAACILSFIGERIDTVDHDPWLLWLASDAYRELGIGKIHQKASDGILGWPERAPYDALIFSAAIPAINPFLFDQLADGGVIIAPVGSYFGPQRLTLAAKRRGHISFRDMGLCVYPPLMGVWSGNVFGFVRTPPGHPVAERTNNKKPSGADAAGAVQSAGMRPTQQAGINTEGQDSSAKQSSTKARSRRR